MKSIEDLLEALNEAECVDDATNLLDCLKEAESCESPEDFRENVKEAQRLALTVLTALQALTATLKRMDVA